MAEPETIVVLGGAGFVGSAVLRQAVAPCMEPRPARRFVSLSRRNGCDLRDLSATCDHLSQLRPTAILNCAAHVGSVHYAQRNAAEMMHDNVLMAVNLYRAVQTAGLDALIVNPLSNCSYPGDADVQREDGWRNGPVHSSVVAYGTHRRLLQSTAECYRRQHGVRSVNWLVANAYGPGDSCDPDRVHALNGIVIRMLQAQASGDRRFAIWGSGKPVREWIFVDDVARMLLASLDLPEQLEPVNLAQNRGYSIAQIAELAADLLEYPVEFEFDTSLPDGAPTKILDDRLFRSRFPDFPFTPLAEGVRKTIDYYRNSLSPRLAPRPC